ncbi:MAG: NAD(+) synthase [bacterium]|nr:NAD(+) synthase [bacterium]
MRERRDGERLRALLRIDAAAVARSIEDAVRRRMEELERDGVVLGLSGGLDSAVAAALCAAAAGPEKTLALLLPDRDSARAHIDDALAWARALRIRTRVVPIGPILRKIGAYRLTFMGRLPLPMPLREAVARRAHAYFERKTGDTPFAAALRGSRGGAFDGTLRGATAYYRVKHRLRAGLIYLHAEIENLLVVGAANRTEYRVGLFVKHGCDDAADIMPILGLYKTQVRALARRLGVPAPIIEKAPSPDLVPGITDEGALGVRYEALDLALCAMDEGWSEEEIAAVPEVGAHTARRARELTERSAHMRRAG